MGKTEDLAKIDRTIKEAELRLKTVQASISALDKEIANVVALESALSANVKCLKTKRVIAIAQEYRNAKEELKRARTRLIVLGNDREHYCKAQKDAETFLKQTKKDYEKMKNENNVIKFRGKKGG
ncbi:MAG TPA: hypothetical protein VN855_00055 [Candidatus Acidoferrum sp.]|nr:hypothetical protein [Candidatus Acidoferrum sp.]